MSTNIALPRPASDCRSGDGAVRQEAHAILLVNDDPGELFALLRLLKQDFCAILMDVKMAGQDGFETARLVRSRPRTRERPIVFLTSHRATDLDRTTGYEVGASDYVFMPVAPEVLKAKVQVFIDRAKFRLLARQSDREQFPPSPALERAPGPAPDADEASRKEGSMAPASSA
jgi:DNA-binding response OmpR family regulator